MRLLEMFLSNWEMSDLRQALKSILDEIESRYGVISDENKIEKAFFQPDKHGNMSGNEIFGECMELYDYLKALNIVRSSLTDFFEELEGWQDSYEVEYLEKDSSEKELQQLEEIIDKINDIPCRKKLLLLKEKGQGWKVDACWALDEYLNGRVTFSDMHVRFLLLKNLSERIRVLIVADSEKGDCCIEI